MEGREVSYLIVTFSIALFVLIVALVGLVSYIQKKKIEYILHRERLNAEHEEQLLKTKVEIAEQGFRRVSWELHDNIGQLLTTALMQLKMYKDVPISDVSNVTLTETTDLLKQCVQEVRSLSRSLNKDAVQHAGLIEALKSELSRIGRIGLVQIKFDYTQDISFGKNEGIFIFRMIQEFIANSLKHAQADHIQIEVSEDSEKKQIEAQDNGIGFDLEDVTKGNGLINLESRAKLINAELTIYSVQGEGTRMTICIPQNKTK